ncbi:PTS sugar transporter subunit IIA [Klebsiella sp. RHBSTW-00215]|uniref:PTS sugar transporter subunit IIA n=1 Tax=Klebsiella sp. RHBSTW-00215 TaxID=2742640 RepID=UPI0015F60668|nr:PTS sugar transporter subunit IIA [Klebsiella sp. RHBSTW-00215]MBA7932441.1 PTS sugar transporter subunit IIA [Klebsiella sp. RHBSTW-00215]
MGATESGNSRALKSKYGISADAVHQAVVTSWTPGFLPPPGSRRVARTGPYCLSPLEEQGLIHTSYAENIIAATEKTGPWYVLTPEFALPHTRPDEGVLSKTSVLSLLSLGDEVTFPGGDSVGLMVVLAAANSEQHIGTIQQLVNLLDENNRLETLLNTQSEESLRQTLSQ